MARARVSAPTGNRAATAWRSAVGLLLSVALLAGCQSNPEPPPLESTSTSTSPSPSPAQAAPTLPPEAKGTSKAAAKAFVRHYVDTVNYAMATGDTEPLSNLSGEDCSTCLEIRDEIDQIYDAGGQLEGSGWKVVSASIVDTAKTRFPLLSVDLRIAPQVAYFRAGASPKRSQMSRGHLDLWLDRNAARWYVAKLGATQ